MENWGPGDRTCRIQFDRPGRIVFVYISLIKITNFFLFKHSPHDIFCYFVTHVHDKLFISHSLLLVH
jgi:hypothetical protein